MPYFKWKGIDLTGSLQKGISRVASAQVLDQQLLQNDIALLAVQQINHWSIFNPITTAQKVAFFRQLSMLLDSGIFLDQALELVQQQIMHRPFKEIVDDVQIDVAHGLSLSNTLAKYPMVFNSITLALVQAGQQAGKLAQSLTMLADHMEAIDEFYKKLRGAALLPIITLLFFLVITSTILLFIVPSFATIFDSLGQPMPTSTVWLMWISSCLSIKGALLINAVIGLVWLFIKKLKTYNFYKRYFDALVLKVPVIGALISQMFVLYFLQSLALLTQNGVHLVTSLRTIDGSLHNESVKKKFDHLTAEIDAGHSLTDALKKDPGFFAQDICAIMVVGEQSGKLGLMMVKAAEVCKEKINRKLFYITTVFQPLLMIVLGLFIVALIVSVYVSIFNVSYLMA